MISQRSIREAIQKIQMDTNYETHYGWLVSNAKILTPDFVAPTLKAWTQAIAEAGVGTKVSIHEQGKDFESIARNVFDAMGHAPGKHSIDVIVTQRAAAPHGRG